MGEKKLTVLIFILFASSLLLFQNCGINNFTAGGNGDPHEGLDTVDTIIDNPTGSPIGQNPDAGNPPGNETSKPGKEIEYVCELEGNEFQTLSFGTQSGHPRIFVSDTGESEKQFFWDHKSLNARHEIYQPISDKTILEIVFFDQQNLRLEVDYFRQNESLTATGTCKEAKPSR